MVRRAYKGMRHPKMRHRKWWQALTKPMMDKRLWRPCRDTVAKGLAIGLLVFMLPIPQSLVAGVLAAWARANVPIAIAATWISNPLTSVALIPLQSWLGGAILRYFNLRPQQLAGATDSWGMKLKHFVTNGALGGLVIGVGLAILGFALVHLFSALMPHHLPKRKERIRGAVPATPKSPVS